MSIENFVWTMTLLAGLGALASLAFYRRAGRPLPPELAARVAAQAPEVRRLASRLGHRPLWVFDVGLTAGLALAATVLLTPGAGSTYAGVGAFLALASLSGRLLVLGGRRRLRRIEEALG